MPTRLPLHYRTVVLTVAVAVAACLLAPAAQARPKVPATQAQLRAAGSRVVITTWAPARGRIELRLRAGSGRRARERRRTTRASRGRATLRAPGRSGARLRLRVRRCVVAAGGRRACSAWSPWRRVRRYGPAPSSQLPVGIAPGGPGAPPTIGRCPMLPPGHALNQDVSALAVSPRSAQYLASIGLDAHVHPDFGAADLGAGSGGFGIPFLIVPATQPLVPVQFGAYAGESDPGPYPVPLDAPIEGGADASGDRHVLVVREGECKLYELGNAVPHAGRWEASGGAVWDLRSGAPRPERWTSADAAGLPILPGLARYDEVAAGAIRHALRFTVSRTQRAYIAPASHWASSDSDPALPPMGLRLRMRADYPTAGFTGQSKVIVEALKRYGMIVADNGSDWYISGAPDPRWNDEDLSQLKAIPGAAFEAVDTGVPVTP